MAPPDWDQLIKEKRAHRDSLIPKEWRLPEHILKQVSPEAPLSAFALLEEANVLTKEEKDLTENYDATALVQGLASRKFTALQVTTAFCKRAAIAQQLINPLTEIFFEEGLARARQLDEYFEREGKPIGPLHGLPVSLKDMLKVKDQFGTMGYVGHLLKPKATENSFIVDMLLDAGAVLYCKTNVPQCLFVMEGYNNVFGQTMNPYKLSLGPAGSSSGEGALVGFRGSILGVGSDIGGSIRGPSLVNGIYGMKPSSDRLPYARQHDLFAKGWPAVVCTVGPHAHSARDLSLFFKTIIDREPWKRDSTAYALPWRTLPPKSKLKIGAWLSDPDLPVLAPVARILKAAIQKLEQAGHEVFVLNNAPAGLPAVYAAGASFRLDAEQTPRKFAREANETLHPVVKEAIELTYMDDAEPPTLGDVWKFNAAREDYREEWGKIWREHDLDVVICPGSRSTAVPHGMYGLPLYTVVWNFVDFPSCVIPYLKADMNLDQINDQPYNSSDIDGAPGSIQVVGWRFQDEEVLRAVEVIADVLHPQQSKL